MDAILLQILNGLDKGSAYALIALGLTLIFGTLGVVNFAHGALFMIGAFCAVTVQRIFNISYETVDETQTDFLGNALVDLFLQSRNWPFGSAVAVSLVIIMLITVSLYMRMAMGKTTGRDEALM